jgi:hypothetical protein
VKAILFAIGQARLAFRSARQSELPVEDINLMDDRVLERTCRPVVSRVEQALRDRALPVEIAIQPAFVVRTASDRFNSVDVHIDNSAFTAVTFLNNDFVGGALEFPTLKHSFIPRVGYCLIFPGGGLYPHSVCPVTVGERFVLVQMCSKSLTETGSVQ